MLLCFCSGLLRARLALRKNNLRRLLLTFEALADLGPTLTGEADFAESARTLLRGSLDAVGAREGVLFAFSEKPAVLRSLAVDGFAAVPDPSLVPLLPRHVHALATAAGPQVRSAHETWDNFLSTNGNVAPVLFRCLSPLRLRGRLVGLLALGRTQDDSSYDDEALDALTLLSHYAALAVHNYLLTQTLEQRVTDNLKLLSSLNSFCDRTLEAFATAIDIKHVNIHGHSMRVGRYAAAIGEALGLDPADSAGLRAAGYLHDIGKVAVDKRLFGKPERLDPEEFREMADHTVVGHRIVSGVQFPWQQLPEVVRWHHERADGSGYPDNLMLEELPLSARIVAVADTFDAMTSERPYRTGMTIGSALSEMVRLTPALFDAAAVQALLIQVRREAVGAGNAHLLDERIYCNIAPTDIDQLASSLSYKLNQRRVYLS